MITDDGLRVCVACGQPIPRGHQSPVYCSKTCQRRAKRQRAASGIKPLGARGPSCPACGKDNPILVHTPVGMVCGDCAPYRSCGKLAYRSRAAAEWAVIGFGLRGVQERDFAHHPAEPYQCPRCGDWHLTTKGER
jgi:hypothetical protein